MIPEVGQVILALQLSITHVHITFSIFVNSKPTLDLADFGLETWSATGSDSGTGCRVGVRIV